MVKNLSVDFTSVGKYTKKKSIEIVCSVNENFYKDNTLPARNA